MPPALQVGVVGCGRVGASLGAALREAGHQVTGTSAISQESLQRAHTMLPGVPVLPVEEVVAASAVVLLTVPDDALADLVSGLARRNAWGQGHLVIHTSGLHGTGVLTPAARAGNDVAAIHPAMTFTGTAKDLPRLHGTPFAVTADPAAAMIAEALVIDLGGDPFELAETDRAAYHFALAHAANHVVTVVAQSQQVLRGIGIEDPSRLLRPLVEAAADNVLENSDRALTGPVARGDVETVRAHLRVAAGQPDDVARAYRALARATAERAVSRRMVPAQAVGPLLRALREQID